MRSKTGLLFVIGPTNAGKSTFLQKAKAAWPEVGLVEVGKMMRAKYPPEHFQGQAAPAHTQVEALQMMMDGIKAAEAAGCPMALIDGQPRDMDQLKLILGMRDKYMIAFLHLWAPLEERERRARERDKDNPAKLELSLARMKNDPPMIYEIFSTVITTPCVAATRNTSQDGGNVLDCLDNVRLYFKRKHGSE